VTFSKSGHVYSRGVKTPFGIQTKGLVYLNITVNNLTKKFGKNTALNNLSVTINEGMYGLLGKNGAGKTTFMRVLTTILPYENGSVEICGVPHRKAKEIRKMTGYLPQDFSLYPSLTVFEALDYCGVLSEIPKKERQKRITELLEVTNLTDQSRKKVKALSGGMKRRLGIAQAMLNDPKVLIVDEPTVGLDPEERVNFREMLTSYSANRIVILSTHIVEDIEETCSVIGILNNGDLIFNGNINEFKEKMNAKKLEAAYMNLLKTEIGGKKK
jgi:ABC-2 type transport system ATP-binding protein